VTDMATTTPNLPAEIFDVPTNVPLIHQVVVAQLPAAVRRSSPVVASSTAPSRVTTASAPPRR